MEEKAEPEIEEGAGGRVGESGPASGQKRQPCESVEGRKVDKGGEDSCLTFPSQSEGVGADTRGGAK